VIIINNLDFMRRLILTVGLGFALITTNAQTTSLELVSSSGDSFNNTNYQLDWSIGELVNETYAASQNILTQGFHQGTYNVTSIDEKPLLKFSIRAFPNPTSDFISLKIHPIKNSNKPESEKFNKIQYTITDLSGKVLQTSKIQSNLKKINFSDYTNGMYLISITQNNQLLKLFQIVKN